MTSGTATVFPLKPNDWPVPRLSCMLPSDIVSSLLHACPSPTSDSVDCGECMPAVHTPRAAAVDHSCLNKEPKGVVGLRRRSEIGKLKVDLEIRKRAVTELSRLKSDMARGGTVTSTEAAALRRTLAAREEEIGRMRRAGAEPGARAGAHAPTVVFCADSAHACPAVASVSLVPACAAPVPQLEASPAHVRGLGLARVPPCMPLL